MYIESLSKYVDNVDRTIGCNTYLNAIALKKLKNKLKQNNYTKQVKPISALHEQAII